jgi:hypothetical protein
MNPESWHDVDLDENTGMPLITNPIAIENAFHWRGVMGRQELVQTHMTIKAWTVATCYTLDEGQAHIKKQQLNETQIILNHVTNGSVFLERRYIYSETAWSSVVNLCIWLKIPTVDAETLVSHSLNADYDPFELEVWKALLPVWIAWHMAIPEIISRVNDEHSLVSRAVDLITSGVQWESALEMANLEDEFSQK